MRMRQNLLGVFIFFAFTFPALSDFQWGPETDQGWRINVGALSEFREAVEKSSSSSQSLVLRVLDSGDLQKFLEISKDPNFLGDSGRTLRNLEEQGLLSPDIKEILLENAKSEVRRIQTLLQNLMVMAKGPYHIGHLDALVVGLLNLQTVFNLPEINKIYSLLYPSDPKEHFNVVFDNRQEAQVRLIFW